MLPAPGTRFGPYEVLSPLGTGGMGAVVRARDTRLDRDVAIKVIRQDLSADRDRLQRFIQEAKAASALNHPNIVTVYDIGTEGDVVFMVMELVGGQPISDVLPPASFSIADVLKIAIQIADACAAAHARHIIHRDLKPANVMLQDDGRIKILDFGLAKFVEQSDDARTMTQTAAGTVLGTAAYMSPEQAEGKPLDARSDIFSLGALLYELVTVQRAFRGDSRASVFAAVLKEDPPPPEHLRADVPAELGRLIMRCLRKDPGRRVQSMADLRAALEELRDDLSAGRLSSGSLAARVLPASEPHPAARRTPWIPLAVGALAVIGLAAYSLWPAGDKPASAVADATLQAVPFTAYAGAEFAGGFSPDGSQLVFSWDGEREDNLDIYVKVIGAGTPLQLTRTAERESEPRWSPDGRNIAFLRLIGPGKVALVLIPPLGGNERILGEFYPRVTIVPLIDLAWTADSRYLLVAGGRVPGERNRIHRVAVNTGEVVSVLDDPASTDGFVAVALSHDGKKLATALDSTGEDTIEVFDLSAEAIPSNPRKFASTGNAIDLAWAPDDGSVLFRRTVNSPGPLYRLDLSSGSVSPMLGFGPGAERPVVSAQAKRLVFTRTVRDANIWRVPLGPGGGPAERIAASSFRDVAPHYSPDGSRIAYHSNRSGTVQIWVANADGSNATQLTAMADVATTGTARWAPDGKRIAFDSNASGIYQIYVISADGGQPRAVTTGPSRNFTAWWSTDGQWIYYTSDRSGQLDIWRISPDGGSSEQVTKSGQVSSASLSPDGQWLYFVRNEGIDGLWRMPAGGGPEERVVSALWRFNYAVTKTGVYYVSRPPQRERRGSVHYLDFATKRDTEIAPINGPVDLGLAISPDGRYLLYSKLDHIGADLMLVEKFR